MTLYLYRRPGEDDAMQRVDGPQRLRDFGGGVLDLGKRRPGGQGGVNTTTTEGRTVSVTRNSGAPCDPHQAQHSPMWRCR